MKLLHLLPIGDFDLGALEEVGPLIARQFHVGWDIVPLAMDPPPATVEMTPSGVTLRTRL